jgi:hypothetical protein
VLDSLLQRIVSWGDGGGKWLGLASALALLVVALLGTSALRLPRSEKLEPTSIAPEDGLAFTAPAPSAWPDGATNESTVEVLEDGIPLTAPHTYPPEIRQQGHGRFAHGRRSVLFSSSDGSDPRTNGRAYTLRYDWFPGWPLAPLLVIAALLLNARRAGRLAALLENAPPARVGAAIFLAALAYRLELVLLEPGLTFGGHIIKGAPFSDASNWYKAARAFSRGDWSAHVWSSWGARRPFYYMLLGSFFALTGPSVLVAQVLNVALSAVTPVAIFDATRRLAPRPVALVGAIVQAFLLYDARTDLAVMTEPLGNFLAALAVWGFVVGAELSREPGQKAWLAFVGGGLALGLSNLARPLTLGAAFGMPLALGLLASVSWRRFFAGSVTFGLGVGLAVGPWMLRQRIVHGIWTISHNTAEIWYAATSPEWGTWRPAVDELAPSNLALRERVAFYMEAASRNIHEHPLWFARHVAEQFGLASRVTQPSSWVLVFACGWAAVRALGSASPRRAPTVLAALLGIGLVSIPDPPLWPVVLLALAAAVLARRPIAVLAGFVATTFLSLAMLAMSCDRRITHAIEWATASLGAWVVLEALAFLETRSLTPRRDLGDRGSWGKAARALGILGALFTALALVGLGRVAIAHPPSENLVLPVEPWRELALVDSNARAALTPVLEKVVARRARVAPGCAIRFEAGERIAHWSILFAPRPYPFTVFEPDRDLPETYVFVPGRLPAEAESGDVVLLGVRKVYPMGVGEVLEVATILSLEGKVLFTSPAPGERPR